MIHFSIAYLLNHKAFLALVRSGVPIELVGLQQTRKILLGWLWSDIFSSPYPLMVRLWQRWKDQRW